VYRWAEHTGELELEIEAETAAGVFEAAAEALGELLGGDDPPRMAATTRMVAVEAPDRAALLAAFIDELVFLAESESLVPAGIEDARVGERTIAAEVAFAAGDPPHLVKAVTYHRLEFERTGTRYRARVVLDV